MPRNLGRVGLDHGGERVREIQTTLVSKVSDQPPSIDTRFKPPHVTLARCKKNARKPQARQIQRALERLEGASLPDPDRFSSVHLVRSSLTPSGPVYENLFEIGLASET
jgi:2'-5' RNA ligase